MGYTISPLEFNRDFVSFAELCRAIYRDAGTADIDMYQWLFPGNIFNPQGAHFLHVAREGGRVIASDGLIPVPLRVGEKKCLAAWSVKTMTHPDYQRRGIFRALTEYSLARAKALGIDLILGFANANSYPGYEKFGWKFLFQRQAVLRPLDIEKSLSNRSLLKPLARFGNSLYRSWDRRRLSSLARKAEGVDTVVLPEAPPLISAIWQQMPGSFSILVERDYPYINWRYNRRPRQDYRFVLAEKVGQPLALLVFRVTSRRFCYLIDYLGPVESEALPALLFRTIQFCRQHSIRLILSSCGCAFDNRLQEYGFKTLPGRLTNNMLIAFPLGDQDLTLLTAEEAWFFSYGDSELDIDLPPGQRLL